MGIRKTTVLATVLLAIASGCATRFDSRNPGADRVTLTLDESARPHRVRFDVPTALILGNPGDDRVPSTLRARVATRALAARELATRGYCPQGFTGPDGIYFPAGDRAHSVFVVRCQA